MAMPPDSTSACTRFFGILELAEIVFLSLPQADLLCGAQQVCRAWKQTIYNSDPIQEYLFFKPISPQRLIYLFGQNSLTWLDLINCSEVVKDSLRKGSPHCDWNSFKPVSHPIENPFFYLLGQKLRGDDIENASWRHMLLTQPPACRVTATVNDDCKELHHIDAANQDHCLTMGNLAWRGDVYKIKGSAEWQAFEDSWQLSNMKKELRLKGMLEDVREDEDGEDKDFDWLMNWTR